LTPRKLRASRLDPLSAELLARVKQGDLDSPQTLAKVEALLKK
jgi:hypothetical protein